MAQHTLLLSIVVPVYNEASGIATFHKSLVQVLKTMPIAYELIYCDDGSRDDSQQALAKLAARNKYVRIVTLSRNFGKELATTAGITAARGDAIITLDADGQHPVELLPEFVTRWQSGASVVIGVRTANHKEGFIKHYGSKLFYSFFNRIAAMKLIPGASDYRLIDRRVQQDFLRMSEHNRITRGLIDWLGYPRDYIYFKARARETGTASYSVSKLLKLAIDSVISLSISPLYVAAYIGLLLLPLSSVLGIGMLVNYLAHDPLHLRATASAYGLVLLLFLVGIILVSQGIIGLYLSHIHTESKNRPLYIVDEARSVRLHDA